MCIAIACKAGHILTDDALYNSYKHNGDGCGMAWIDETNTIQIYKSLIYKDFLAKYHVISHQYGQTSDMLVHFRIKTHGLVDLTNCHPFQVNDDTVFIHNGTITGLPTAPDKSDTYIFNEVVLKYLTPNWEECEALRLLIESFIGWSKLCVLNRGSGIHIYNEAKGTWVDGIWYSNDSYKTRAVTTTYSDNYYKSSSHTRAGSYGEFGDWKIKLPVTKVEQVKKPTADIYNKCVVCDKWHKQTEMFINVARKETDEYYCFDCVEFLYLPDDTILLDTGVETTFLDYIFADGSLTPEQLEDYMQRVEYVYESIALAGLNNDDTYDEDEEDTDETQVSAI